MTGLNQPTAGHDAVDQSPFDRLARRLTGRALLASDHVGSSVTARPLPPPPPDVEDEAQLRFPGPGDQLRLGSLPGLQTAAATGTAADSGAEPVDGRTPLTRPHRRKVHEVARYQRRSAPRGMDRGGASNTTGSSTTRISSRAFALIFLGVLTSSLSVYLLTPSAFLQSVVLASAAVLAIASLTTGCLIHRPRPLAPWMLMSVAGAFFLAGYVVRPWSLDQAGLGLYLVDALTLTGYLALLAGLWWLARAHGGIRREVLCDVLIASAAAALAALQHLVVPAVLLAGRPVATSVLSAIYPLIDVVLVCLLLDVLITAPARRSYQLLTAAVAALLAGDLWYAWWGTHGTLLPPGAANAPFLVAYLLIAAAALHPSQRQPSAARGTETGAPVDTAADRVVQAAGTFGRQLDGARGPHRPEAWSGRRLLLLGASLSSLVTLLATRPSDAPGVTRWAGVVAVAVVLGLLVVRAVSAVNGLARARAVLAHRASHDPLTELPNREELDRLIAAEIGRGPVSAGRRRWLLYLDLDGFKRVNDSWGHLAGDELLREVAHRLRQNAGPEAVVARLAGDEFGVTVTADFDGMTLMAQKLLLCIAAPVSLSAAEVTVTTSIGVTHVRTSAHTALREADAAMYAAKRSGRSQWLLYDDTMRTDQGAAIELELDLRHAIDEGGLSLAYQLIVDIDDSRPVGTEALLRWERPVAGAVSPAVFVPVLEDTGLITNVGLWVLQEALGQLSGWRRDDVVDERFKMSVNVAPRQLMDPTFTQNVQALLHRNDVPGSSLILEITESSMLADADAVAENLNALCRLGITLAVDDFGTGYSALSYLRKLPVSRVKIDRSFVSRLGEDHEDGASDEALVRAVVAVSEALGLGVTAEGIETPAQHDVLRRLGVRHGQGWLWARAEAPDRVTAVLTQARAEPPTGAPVEQGTTSRHRVTRAPAPGSTV